MVFEELAFEELVLEEAPEVLANSGGARAAPWIGINRAMWLMQKQEFEDRIFECGYQYAKRSRSLVILSRGATSVKSRRAHRCSSSSANLETF
jgi:hypothetical protein